MNAGSWALGSASATIHAVSVTFTGDTGAAIIGSSGCTYSQTTGANITDTGGTFTGSFSGTINATSSTINASGFSGSVSMTSCTMTNGTFTSTPTLIGCTISGTCNFNSDMNMTGGSFSSGSCSGICYGNATSFGNPSVSGGIVGVNGCSYSSSGSINITDTGGSFSGNFTGNITSNGGSSTGGNSFGGIVFTAFSVGSGDTYSSSSTFNQCSIGSGSSSSAMTFNDCTLNGGSWSFTNNFTGSVNVTGGTFSDMTFVGATSIISLTGFVMSTFALAVVFAASNKVTENVSRGLISSASVGSGTVRRTRGFAG